MRLAREAYDLASRHGYVALAKQVKSVLDGISQARDKRSSA